MELLDDWKADENHEPVGPPKIRVYGTCRFGELGWTVALRRAERQGINPRILMLDLVATPPDEIAGQQVDDKAVEPFEEEVPALPAPQTQYDQVHVKVVGHDVPGRVLDVRRLD